MSSQTELYSRNVSIQYNYKPKYSSVACGVTDIIHRVHQYEAFVMTEEVPIQERQAQTDEKQTQEIFVNVGVEKWEDKSVDFKPLS